MEQKYSIASNTKLPPQPLRRIQHSFSLHQQVSFRTASQNKVTLPKLHAVKVKVQDKPSFFQERRQSTKKPLLLSDLMFCEVKQEKIQPLGFRDQYDLVSFTDYCVDLFGKYWL